jgi:putative transposase
VRNSLRRPHMEPAPQRRTPGRSGAPFLTRHWDVPAATDFFTVEVAPWHGLVTYSVLVVMELATRRGQIAGITPHPTAAFMPQCARQWTDPCDGCLLGTRSRLQDRETTCTQAFAGLLKHRGVEPISLPPPSPPLHAHWERCVRAIKEEALEQLVLGGERAPYDVLHQSLSHSHAERNPQGLANQRSVPEPGSGSDRGQVRRRERLGGLLSYYARDAA